MSAFFSSYEHQLDAKNRMRIPAKLKSELGKDFAFVRGTDHCVFILPKSEVERYVKIASEIPLGDPRIKAARMFMKNIVTVKEDDHGRILFPNEMRAHLKLEKEDRDLVICGAGSRIEVWSKATYDSYYGDEDMYYDENVKSLF